MKYFCYIDFIIWEIEGAIFGMKVTEIACWDLANISI
jgi:hypothetical protein